MGFQIPECGWIHWPVNNGDATTIGVANGVVMQVDVHHMAQADDDRNPSYAVVDELVDSLPKKNGRPYLAAFVLTHPDQDHCKGFADLLKRVHIGELWMSPRTFWEFKKDLCPDAKALCNEALRRVDVCSRQANVNSGDRVRIIGFADILHEKPEYARLPDRYISVPGHSITEIDGIQLAGRFKIFVLAPFKEDSEGDRNDCSVGFQLSLTSSNQTARSLMLGDLSCDVIKRIFERTPAEHLMWDVLLSPHHCSKGTMYWRPTPEGNEVLCHEVLAGFERGMLSGAKIIASSCPIPGVNEPNDNPPHARAKTAYLALAPEEFICTQEFGGAKTPVPVIFEVLQTGLTRKGPMREVARSAGLAAAVRDARGSTEPPTQHVGFGQASAP